MRKRLVTISDLHISAKSLDDFDGEIESKFGDFLSELGSGPEQVELVINGDFLDFVQAPPYEGAALEAVSSAEGLALFFNENQSLEKLQAIYAAHPGVFVALQKFLAANPVNEITLLPGNHDADLFWRTVQSNLRERIGSSDPGRCRIHLERVYQPISFPGVWIEHGHQFDQINSFFFGNFECWSAQNPPIFVDERGQSRLLACLGTRFMIRFLNRLDRDYPFVDNVKPFSLFVRLFAASALVSGYASLQVAISMWRMLSYLVRTGIASPSDLLSADGEPLQLDIAVVHRLRDLNERSKELQNRVHKEGFNPSLPLSLVLDDPSQAEELMVFLSEHFDLLKGLDQDDTGYLSVSGDSGTLSLARGFGIDESKELVAGAMKILIQNDAKVVVMGHTHEPLDRGQTRTSCVPGHC
jgi:UDP-2,3-diacylglucosamine pyrophosphatase LpxH